MSLSVIGIDLAKGIIQVRGSKANGKKIFNKAIKQTDFFEFMSQQPHCLIGMEACGSAHYWGRRLESLGHTVKLMHAGHVKPFVMGQKNDKNDAAGCAVAVKQADMRFVPIKTIEQQDIQRVLRIQERMERQQTALINQTRGFLREYGIYIRKGPASVFKAIPCILEDAENELTVNGRELIAQLGDELVLNRERLKAMDKRIARMAKASALCQVLIQKIVGIGPMTALTLVNLGLRMLAREMGLKTHITCRPGLAWYLASTAVAVRQSWVGSISGAARRSGDYSSCVPAR